MSSAPERAGRQPRGRQERNPGLVFDDRSPFEQLAIVEKYEVFINYIYKIAQNAPRKHGVARDAFLKGMFDLVDLFIIAGKSGQASRLYSADAQLAALRFWLRFMVHPDRKIITPHQHKVASEHLAEVGRMLGGWIKSVKGGG